MEGLNDTFWNTVNRYYSLKREDDEKDNPKCVICHGHGSSIFSIVTDKNRKLKIECDNKNPCSIEIILPPFSLLTKELSSQYERIEFLQNKIIEIKNEFIFGYITEEETVDTFQQLKTDLNKSIVRSEHLFQLLVDIKPDEIKIDEHKKERRELILLYKSLITEYKTTKSPIHLEKAITVYKDITAKNKEIMKSTYLYNNVEQDDGKYKLIQRELPIDSIEMIDLELVKNVDLQKYIQSDTTQNKPLEEELMDPEIEPEPKVTEKPKKTRKQKLIKIADKIQEIEPEIDPEIEREIEEIEPKVTEKSKKTRKRNPIKIKIVPDD